MTTFVDMYHPLIPSTASSPVHVAPQAVDDYEARGWLELDPQNPPPVIAPYLTQAAGDSRYLPVWRPQAAVVAGQVFLAPDGQQIQRTADGTTRATYDTTEQAAWSLPLRAALVPKWKANTAYASGEFVLNPSGQIVSANTAFTSGASYSGTNWTVVSGGGGTVSDATTSAKGIVQLAGDLAGTAAAPTVPALANKLNITDAASTYVAKADAIDLATTQDDVAGMFTGGTQSGVTFTYDSTGKLVSNALVGKAVRDLVGQMIANGTQNGITFTYDATAGSLSATVTATTGSAPGAPTAPTLGTATSATQPLSWTAPSSAGTSAITDYQVQYKKTSDSTWTTFSDGVSTSTSATVTGLTASTSYDYRVAAINAVGTGPVSTTATGSTTAPPAISLSNHYTGLTSTASTTNTVTGVTAAVGQVMVFTASVAAGSAKAITGISGPGGNTWTMRQAITGAAGTNSRVEIWTTTVTTAISAATITATFSSAVAGFFDVSVWNGVTTTGILGNTAGQVSTSTAAPACTVTTTGPAAIITAAAWSQTTAPTTAGTGWTQFGGGSSAAADYGAAGYLVPSTAGTYGPSWATTSAATWGIATIALPGV